MREPINPTSTNLPNECCDALFLRNVYHHVTEPAAWPPGDKYPTVFLALFEKK